jgi:hypothetical protein
MHELKISEAKCMGNKKNINPTPKGVEYQQIKYPEYKHPTMQLI